MAGVPPNSLRQDELPEYPFVGPFGGVQSEVPLDRLGRSGFQEVQNVLFRKSTAIIAPHFIPLTSPSGETIVGIADFFNVNGNRLFVVWTPTKMFVQNGPSWTQITGVLTGSVSQFMMWDVVGYKLYFSQQKDVVQVWDGITPGFAAASASAVPAKYLCELDFHLLAANTIEAGTGAPNRIHWTGIGDGTDWTSFSSGQADLFNGLGPINGLARVYQYAYAFQQWGITQIVPTGIGTSPFEFIAMGSRAKGSILPYGVASFGELIACYVGKNNIFVFDGTQSIAIGDKPIDGNRRLGARSRIFGDLVNTTLTNIFGFIATSVNGYDYESYWLFMPGLNKAWVYHFDEGSWTQVFFSTQIVGPAGVFQTTGTSPRIEDLVGPISAQTWSPATLTVPSALDTFAISADTQKSVSLLNFNIPSNSPTSGSINPSDGWYIKSGALTFDDPRHAHTVKKIRYSGIDFSNITINIQLTNEYGQQVLQTLTYGTGSGAVITRVLEFSLSGRQITWQLSGPQGIGWGMTELTLIYDTGGEIQGGTR